MSPSIKNVDDDPQKISILRQIAKVCKRQGSYHLATKKYTQVKIYPEIPPTHIFS